MSSAAGDREQKMLDSTTQNLSERLTEVRKTLGTLITKVRRNFNYLTDRAALSDCTSPKLPIFFISDGNRS